MEGQGETVYLGRATFEMEWYVESNGSALVDWYGSSVQRSRKVQPADFDLSLSVAVLKTATMQDRREPHFVHGLGRSEADSVYCHGRSGCRSKYGGEMCIVIWFSTSRTLLA